MPPFLGLVGDELVAQFVAENLLDKGIGSECFYCFVQRPWKFGDATGGELFLAEFVEVVLVRIAGVEFLADALESGGEHEGGCQIGIAGGVGVAALATAAGHRDSDGVGAVVAAVAVEDGSPGEVGHQAAADKSLVAVDGGRECGAERGAVLEHAGDELIAELADAEAARVVGVVAVKRFSPVSKS